MTAHFHFLGHHVEDEHLQKLPDNLVLQDMRDGALIVRRRTERVLPVPRKASER